MLKCNGCRGEYIGHTGRSFSTRFLEHISDIRFDRDKSKYAKHILDHHQHEYGKKEETMEILKVINKGNLMYSYERYYIQKYSTEGICLNEQHRPTNNSPTSTSRHTVEEYLSA
jgi:hypothetical protein